MINVRCSELENARENPAAYGQLLAAKGIKNGGGRGMLACVKEVVLAMPEEGLSVSQGINRIQQKFMTFNPTKENKERQEQLILGFVAYCKQIEKYKFEFVNGSKMMKWDFSKDTRLTGLTPWVFSNSNDYFALALTETKTNWYQQLKFPLYQSYLAAKIIACPITKMNVGIFCLETGQFEFESFSEELVNTTVVEVNQILETILATYNKYKN